MANVADSLSSLTALPSAINALVSSAGSAKGDLDQKLERAENAAVTYAGAILFLQGVAALSAFGMFMIAAKNYQHGKRPGVATIESNPRKKRKSHKRRR